jgi:CRP/FNR family transcriptional regulator
MDGLQRRILNSSAIALETTGLCELPAHQLDSLSQRFAIVQHRLIKHLAGQLSSAQTMLLIMSKRTAEERVATFIVDLMQRLETRGFSGKEFDLSMTRYDIASYLGLAVETVSRAFKALESEGLVNVRARHIRIKNVAALRVLASACS